MGGEEQIRDLDPLPPSHPDPCTPPCFDPGQILRSDGRRQAAQRMLKQKREGQQVYHSGADGSEDD